DDRERSDRFDRDVALAQSILDDGIDAFLQRWTTTGLTDTTGLDDDTRVADMAMRGENSAEGLASAVIGYGQGAMEPAWDRLGSVTCPTLLLTGAEDTAYTAIAHELAPAMGDARVVTIADAGHNPLLDQPGETARTISAFLDDLG
ncbi:MAG: alpha/beta fold hydrolase, partial [Acidimicrobiia bacterium]|nr:alpha/beta fold hydrolase [Acidimicrobiia bacterium]